LYEFDGHRQGLLGRHSVPSFDAGAFQVAIGGGYDVYHRDGLRVTPGAGLRFVDAHTDGFTERGGPGSLTVSDQDDDALLLDLGVHLFYQQPGQPYAFEGGLGWQHDFSDSERDVKAALALGGPAFEVTSPGLGDDAFFFTLGSHYDFNERYRIGLSYRGELRSDADPFHGLDLRFTAGF
jgi:subtilase-type serine protease